MLPLAEAEDRARALVKSKHPAVIYHTTETTQPCWAIAAEGLEVWLSTAKSRKDAVRFCVRNDLPYRFL